MVSESDSGRRQATLFGLPPSPPSLSRADAIDWHSNQSSSLTARRKRDAGVKKWTSADPKAGRDPVKEE